MVLDDSSLDMAASLYGIPKLAEQMVRHTHEGQRSDVPVIDLEDSLVGRFRLVQSTMHVIPGQHSLTNGVCEWLLTLISSARCRG